MEFDKNVTCAFTGHRILDDSFSKDFLKQNVENLLDRGYRVFLVGMALGFDTECFHVLEKLRRKISLKIIACIPCSEQPDTFGKTQKDEYFRMLKESDEQILVSPSYYNGCMQKRNRFMVDNSTVVVAFVRKNRGGAYSTVKYAEKQRKEIIKI